MGSIITKVFYLPLFSPPPTPPPLTPRNPYCGWRNAYQSYVCTKAGCVEFEYEIFFPLPHTQYGNPRSFRLSCIFLLNRKILLLKALLLGFGGGGSTFRNFLCLISHIQHRCCVCFSYEMAPHHTRLLPSRPKRKRSNSKTDVSPRKMREEMEFVSYTEIRKTAAIFL